MSDGIHVKLYNFLEIVSPKSLLMLLPSSSFCPSPCFSSSLISQPPLPFSASSITEFASKASADQPIPEKRMWLTLPLGHSRSLTSEHRESGRSPCPSLFLSLSLYLPLADKLAVSLMLPGFTHMLRKRRARES